MNLGEWIRSASHRLDHAGIDSGTLEAQLLAAHLFRRERTWVIAHPEAEVDELSAEALLQRRESREPLAYILGWREFFGRRFEVGPGVLIPRQETEHLLEAALTLTHHGPVLDLGTGSGCIAISLKLEKPDVEVWASDVSRRALNIAQRNAELHGSDVRFIESDVFTSFPEIRFESIITNPPYIADAEALMPEVALHEPSSALFAGPTGLEFYERLASDAPTFLEPGGKIAMEIGVNQAEAVKDVFTRQGWRPDRMTADLAGIDRVVVFTRPRDSVLS